MPNVRYDDYEYNMLLVSFLQFHQLMLKFHDLHFMLRAHHHTLSLLFFDPAVDSSQGRKIMLLREKCQPGMVVTAPPPSQNSYYYCLISTVY